MITSVGQAIAINTEPELMKEFQEMEADLYTRFRSLTEALDKSIFSTDIGSLEGHVGFVESFSNRLTRYHSITLALVEHSKSDSFLPEGKVREWERDAQKKRLSAGFIGLNAYIEGTMEDVRSRVMLVKKKLGIEEQLTTRTVRGR